MMKKVLVSMVLIGATASMAFMPSKASAAEHVALDVTREYHTGFTGFREDDTFAVAGHVTRVDVSYEKNGPFGGDAFEVLPRQPGQVKIHRWLDALSSMKVHIVVFAD